jgi:hypothetical protein
VPHMGIRPDSSTERRLRAKTPTDRRLDGCASVHRWRCTDARVTCASLHRLVRSVGPAPPCYRSAVRVLRPQLDALTSTARWRAALRLEMAARWPGANLSYGSPGQSPPPERFHGFPLYRKLAESLRTVFRALPLTTTNWDLYEDCVPRGSLRGRSPAPGASDSS